MRYTPVSRAHKHCDASSSPTFGSSCRNSRPTCSASSGVLRGRRSRLSKLMNGQHNALQQCLARRRRQQQHPERSSSITKCQHAGESGSRGEWGRPHAPSPNREKQIGFLHEATWNMVKRANVRLEFIAKFRLSVEAMGRSELNISARLKAGMGEVDWGVGAEVDVDAMEPAEDLRAMSVDVVLVCNDVMKVESSSYHSAHYPSSPCHSLCPSHHRNSHPPSPPRCSRQDCS